MLSEIPLVYSLYPLEFKLLDFLCNVLFRSHRMPMRVVTKNGGRQAFPTISSIWQVGIGISLATYTY